jgi:hypothetical protein
MGTDSIAATGRKRHTAGEPQPWSADSLVRELPVLGMKHADKAVRAPEESSPNETKSGASAAKGTKALTRISRMPTDSKFSADLSWTAGGPGFKFAASL